MGPPAKLDVFWTNLWNWPGMTKSLDSRAGQKWRDMMVEWTTHQGLQNS